MSVDWGAVAARVFKEESARILAALIRLSGSFDWAEEAMQDAFTRALTEWPEKGVPTNPGAWITTVARRRIVDRARREVTRTEYEPSVAAPGSAFFFTTIQGSRTGAPFGLRPARTGGC